MCIYIIYIWKIKIKMVKEKLIIKTTVKSFGNGAHIIVPKEYIGKEVLVIQND